MNTHGGAVKSGGTAARPSPVRASTTTVNARPSSGLVAAPTAPVPDADVAAVSICSIMPRTTAGQTRTEAVALRLGRSSTAGSILGKKLRSRVWVLTRFVSVFFISSPNPSRSRVRVASRCVFVFPSPNPSKI
jgi:hypothetical protein